MRKILHSIYVNKKTLSAESNAIIQEDLKTFNSMMRTAFVYNNQGRTFETSIADELQAKYNVQPCFAEAADQQAKELLSSEKEKRAQHIAELENAIATQKRQIEGKREAIETLQQAKRDLIVWSKQGGRVDELDLKVPGFSVSEDEKVSVRDEKSVRRFASVYEFEHKYLDQEMAVLRADVKELVSVNKQMEQELKRLSSQKRIKVSFGEDGKSRGMRIDGNCRSFVGNDVFSYDPKEKVLRYRSLTESDRDIVFENVVLQSGEGVLGAVIAYNGQQPENSNVHRPISWEIEDCGEVWRICCSVIS